MKRIAILLLFLVSVGLIVFGIFIIVYTLPAHAFWNYVPPSKKHAVAPSPSAPAAPIEQPVPLLPPYLGPVPTLAPICKPVTSSSADLLPIVAEAQQLLAIVGRDPGAFDGVFSKKTQAAVLAYEKDSNYPVDGCLSPDLIQHLRTMAPNPYYGLTGLPPDVLEAQVLLVRLGYYIGAVDGNPGSKTQNAVRDFQEIQGLPITGQVTPSLVKSLRQAYNHRAGITE